MFTGLVEAQGTVRLLEKNGSAIDLTLEISERITNDAHIGDSVAINGCCLTVVEISDGFLKFQAGAETLAKTNLGRLSLGDQVNIERPLAADGRLGGTLFKGTWMALARLNRSTGMANGSQCGSMSPKNLPCKWCPRDRSL